MLTIAVGLLVVDGLATCWLVTRRRRARRVRLDLDQPTAAAQNVAPGGRANDEPERRLANLRAQWGASLDTSSADRTTPVRPPAPIGTFSELRRAAELLAATEQVIYDPAVWEA